VRERGRLRPPLPFDTTAALRRVSATTPRQAHLALVAPATASRILAFVRLVATRPAMTASFGGLEPTAVADTFSHERHTRISCIVCHETGDGHGRLTFARPRGCAICHHQAPASARCASCHRTDEYGSPRKVTVTVAVPDRQPRPRPVDFLHSAHTSRACVECHTTPVTLAPAPNKAQCRDCHGDHHTAGRSCSSCHAVVEPGAAHQTLDVAHQRCDACHTVTTIAQLTPTRTFCSTCHTEKAGDHYVQKECSVCHFLAEPGTYRSRLVRPSPG
jgi:hypothetical protein